MSKNVAISEELYDKAAKLAARDHVSVDEFVSAVLANGFARGESIEARAARFSREEFDRALNEIPDVEPESYDRL